MYDQFEKMKKEKNILIKIKLNRKIRKLET